MTGALERSLEPTSGPPLRRWRGVVFRLGVSYWGLICLYIVVVNTSAFDWFTAPVSRAVGAFGEWIGKTLLAIPYEFSGDYTGSGDRTSDWVVLLCMAAIALLATVAWSLLDRRSTRDPWLREVIRILVRYTLAFSMLGYGVLKLFRVQFSPPLPGQLIERVGDASPMGLLWTFMGVSPAYVVFAGAAETLGAVLLLFRRTTMLGALVLAGVMTNVVMLNFCYDVPVKIMSAHYLAMCLFLLLPDLRRLANVIVLDGIAQPAARGELVLRARWMRVTRRVVKCGVIGVVAIATVQPIASRYSMMTAEQPRTWYGGTWAVTSFHRDGQEVPANLTETTRWKRVRFQPQGGKVLFRWVDSSYGDLYDAAIDEHARVITLTFDDKDHGTRPPQPGLGVIVFTYVRIDDNHLQLEGKVGLVRLSVQLERVETSNMLLLARGFHWINEQPFNR